MTLGSDAIVNFQKGFTFRNQGKSFFKRAEMNRKIKVIVFFKIEKNL